MAFRHNSEVFHLQQDVESVTHVLLDCLNFKGNVDHIETSLNLRLQSQSQLMVSKFSISSYWEASSCHLISWQL